ncbi:MAG: sulfate transporter CysZ [Candidatus Competibacteraceae bacterium]|nr:sulfate transporter CysZ [Candidatus Competibacteraceae bacterium]
MVGPFLRGFGYLLTGFRLLPHPQVRTFVVIPFLINAGLFSIGIWWAWGAFEGLIQSLVAWLPDWLDWLSWLLWPLFVVAQLIVVFYTFTLVANLVAAPFNGTLAERVEDLVGPNRQRPPQRPLWAEAAIAPLVELKKLGYFIAWTLPLLLLFFIPPLNLAAPFVWAAFTAWMLALQYMDYPMGNHRLPFKEQRKVLAEKRWLGLGFGAGVLAMTLVPVLNFLAMPTAVVGATVLFVNEFPRFGRQGD